MPHVISNVAHRRRGFRQQVNPNVIESYDQLDYSYLSYIQIQYPLPLDAALVVRRIIYAENIFVDLWVP